MKILALILFFLSSLSAPVLAQKKSTDFLSEFTIRRIGLSAPDSQKITLKDIRSVIVLDFRLDTTSLGFMQQNAHHKYVIRSKKHLEKDIEQLIKEFTNTGNKVESLDLVLAINKLWLTDEIVNDVNADIDPHDTKEFKSGIMVKYEFALSDGENYYPLLRFDSVIIGDKNISDYSSGYIFESLYCALSKVSELTLSGSQNRLKKLTYPDIINYYSERSNLAVFKDNAYKKGIYKTFAEFKRNAPSITDYEIKLGEREDFIFEKGKNGSVTSVRDIWGYCDGEKIYIRSAENFFELVKRGQAFYSYAAKSPSRKTVRKLHSIISQPVGLPTNSSNRKFSYSIKQRPYQLDILSGDLY